MKRFISTLFALSLGAQAASAQAPADTVARLDTIMQRLKSLEALRIWPGFRPDTISVAFVLPAHGSIVLNWPGAVPEGYQAIAGVRNALWRDQRDLGAASTGTSIAGRPVAQVVVSSLDPSVLLPTAVHEAFHVFQGASAKPGRRFGRGENSFHVASYPVFDVENEMLFAREGELLLAALRGPTLARRRELARQFVAVRRARHRRLDDSFAQFDRASEMNEGLAQYAQVRALTGMARDPRLPAEWRSLARKLLANELGGLADLTGNVAQSFRLRYYLTGPAQAMLLDSLSGSQDWKHEMMLRNETLQDALGRVSGLDAAEASAFSLATLHADSVRLSGVAQTAVSRLKALRAAQVDSVLSRPGILLELSASELPARDFGSCMFDPQNLFQVTATVQLHNRTWRPCAGAALVSELNVPAVHDRSTGMIRTVIGSEAEVKITINGAATVLADGQTISAARAVRVEAPRVSVQSARATLSRSGRTIRIIPLQ